MATDRLSMQKCREILRLRDLGGRLGQTGEAAALELLVAGEQVRTGRGRQVVAEANHAAAHLFETADRRARIRSELRLVEDGAKGGDDEVDHRLVAEEPDTDLLLVATDLEPDALIEARKLLEQEFGPVPVARLL